MAKEDENKTKQPGKSAPQDNSGQVTEVKKEETADEKAAREKREAEERRKAEEEAAKKAAKEEYDNAVKNQEKCKEAVKNAEDAYKDTDAYNAKESRDKATEDLNTALTKNAQASKNWGAAVKTELDAQTAINYANKKKTAAETTKKEAEDAKTVADFQSAAAKAEIDKINEKGKLTPADKIKLKQLEKEKAKADAASAAASETITAASETITAQTTIISEKTTEKNKANADKKKAEKEMFDSQVEINKANNKIGEADATLANPKNIADELNAAAAVQKAQAELYANNENGRLAAERAGVAADGLPTGVEDIKREELNKAAYENKIKELQERLVNYYNEIAKDNYNKGSHESIWIGRDYEELKAKLKTLENEFLEPATDEVPITSTDVENGQEITPSYLAQDWMNQLTIYFPQFGVREFINERTIWQKQLYTLGAERGWFYFKILFNFTTGHGLLCNLVPNEFGKLTNSTQNAAYYLASIDRLYKHEQIPHRLLALYKFGATLKAIQTETPWIFKEVHGLDQVDGTGINNIGKRGEIELAMNSETVDMRIGTLMDLYKYACYDSINHKEIIPSNLRKFDMFILTYHVPIRGYQSEIGTGTNLSIAAKSTIPTAEGDGTNSIGSNFSNMMSFKMYTFLNCEFLTSSLNGYTPQSITNETAFNMGNNNIKIQYGHCYEHRMNEWCQFMFGDNGFYYNEYTPSPVLGYGMLHDKVCGYKINAAGTTFKQADGTEHSLKNKQIQRLKIWGDKFQHPIDYSTIHSIEMLKKKFDMLEYGKEKPYGERAEIKHVGERAILNDTMQEYISNITKRNADHSTIPTNYSAIWDSSYTTINYDNHLSFDGKSKVTDNHLASITHTAMGDGELHGWNGDERKKLIRNGISTSISSRYNNSSNYRHYENDKSYWEKDWNWIVNNIRQQYVDTHL